MVGGIPLRPGDGQIELEFSIAAPGTVRALAWCLEKRLVMSRAGDAQFDEVLTMFVESLPGQPQRRRRFAVLATGQRINAPEGYALDFIGSAVSGNTGQVAHVYEVKQIS